MQSLQQIIDELPQNWIQKVLEEDDVATLMKRLKRTKDSKKEP